MSTHRPRFFLSAHAGLNDELVAVIAKLTNNPRFAYDSYRRFITMFADVVMGVSKHHFDKARMGFCAQSFVLGKLEARDRTLSLPSPCALLAYHPLCWLTIHFAAPSLGCVGV